MRGATNGKGRAAFLAAGFILLFVAACVAGVWYFASRASITDPDPSGLASGVGAVLSDGTRIEEDGIDWDYWLSVNPDIVGWIRIPGTGIDAPIVHAPEADPDYYLSHDVYGTSNPLGAIYLDSESLGLFEGGNSVIFGHHFGRSSWMFADLARFSDRNWAQEHSRILLLTPDGGLHVLSVQCADVVRGNEAIKRTDFADSDDLASYWGKRFEESSMKLAEEAAETDQMFMLVTCSYNFGPDNERTVVYAIEEGAIPPSSATD